MQIRSTNDENLDTDIETDVIHLQCTPKHQSILNTWHVACNIEQHDSGLWWKDNALIVVENDNLRRGVLMNFHNSSSAGHPSIAKTIDTITPYYWWPGMYDFITQYIKGCTTCQMNKVNTHLTKPLLYLITTAPNVQPFETIALDFIVKLPISNGYNTILTITDHNCSKAMIFIPCNEIVNSEGVVKLYAQHMIPHYRLPQKVISDRDTWFTSNFTKELCHVLGVKQNISTTYHLQTDGQSEHTNQSLEQYLHIVCGEHQNNWADWLPLAQYV